MDAVVTVNGKDVTISRAKFKLWLLLSDIQSNISAAVRSRDLLVITDCISSYLLTAAPFVDLNKLPWYEAISLFTELQSLNTIRKELPIFEASKIEEKKDPPWEYSGRSWYKYLHILASAYNWSIEYIENLVVEDAFSLLEEIYLNDQLQKEWEWSISSRSVGYEKNTNKPKFIELPRPPWMQGTITRNDIPKITIEARQMPVGNVIDVSGMMNVIPFVPIRSD